MQYNTISHLYSITVECYSALKKMNYQAMERHEGNLNACYQLKEAYLITITVGFQLYDVLEKNHGDS